MAKTDEGLKLHVMSASPFAVAWKSIAVETPDDSDDDDDDSDETGENVTTTAVKTGDNMNVATVIWSIVLVAAAAGAGVLVYRRRRNSNGTKNE